MEHIGIDVHKNQSQICILTSEGELIEKRIVTGRGRFAAVFGSRPGARILIEASTESEWVARCLEALGHEVVVGDPNYSPMYGRRTRRVKTDRRDAHSLSELLWINRDRLLRGDRAQGVRRIRCSPWPCNAVHGIRDIRFPPKTRPRIRTTTRVLLTFDVPAGHALVVRSSRRDK